MTSTLEAPSTPDALYLARGEDVSVYRPLLQGDVLMDIAIPGVDDIGDNLAMIATHACGMRRGGPLREHLHVLRVAPYQNVPLQDWETGHYRVMPLPGLSNAAPSFAADFDLQGRVKTADLDIRRRIACLSRPGILLLQQRLAHHYTRVVVDTPTLYRESAHVLEEADLLDEWCEAKLAGNVQEDEFAHAIALECDSFDALLSRDSADGPLRSQLADPATVAVVRRAVRAELRGT